MERIHASGSISKPDSLRVNYCCLYLWAYMASDITTPDGRQIHQGSFQGNLAQHQNSPGIKFPRQGRPDKVSWAQWRRALRLIFTNPRCTQLRLLAPLGPWYPNRSDATKWLFYRSDDALVVRSRITDGLTKYPLETHGRRALTYLKQKGRIVLTLPSSSVPTCAPTEDSRTWVSRPRAGLNFVPAALLKNNT
jgi:hypothetical protein